MVEINQGTEEDRLINNGLATDAGNQSQEITLSDSQFRINIMKMTVMWCTVSFS